MEQKLGGGIITISVLTLIGFAINLITYLAILAMGDSLNEMYSSMGLGNIIPPTSTLVVSLILSIIIYFHIQKVTLCLKDI